MIDVEHAERNFKFYIILITSVEISLICLVGELTELDAVNYCNIQSSTV